VTWLLLLLPIAAVALIVWNHQRKIAAREAASNERMKELFAKPSADADAPAAEQAAAGVPAAAANTPAPPAPKEYAPRAAMLTPPQRVLYYLLKAQLSDHEVLVKAGAATFIDIPARFGGFERETRERRLALAVVDFVVCDKSFRPLVVVHCHEAGGADTPHIAFARECCAAAQLRWVDIAPGALPARDAVRVTVLGQ
jgi:Protein of unknown function (DUF2726)